MPDSSRSRPTRAAWPLLALGGFVLCFVLIAAGIAFVLDRGIVPWPLQGTPTAEQAYANAAVYSPVVFFALFSLVWPAAAGVPVATAFRWERLSWIFFVALIISAGRSVYMLTSGLHHLRGPAFWPPVAILCALNAFSEELVYRFSFLSLLREILKSRYLSNFMQSALYSLTHIPVGGTELALLALCYGLLLGTVMERHRSVIPCVICHFAIDIGYVGLPLLRV